MTGEDGASEAAGTAQRGQRAQRAAYKSSSPEVVIESVRPPPARPGNGPPGRGGAAAAAAGGGDVAGAQDPQAARQFKRAFSQASPGKLASSLKAARKQAAAALPPRFPSAPDPQAGDVWSGWLCP